MNHMEFEVRTTLSLATGLYLLNNRRGGSERLGQAPKSQPGLSGIHTLSVWQLVLCAGSVSAFQS